MVDLVCLIFLKMSMDDLYCLFALVFYSRLPDLVMHARLDLVYLVIYGFHLFRSFNSLDAELDVGYIWLMISVCSFQS